ncbi:MAG TPA: DUF4180 domain-containing protein [Candidatus Binatus sp.]|uniref:DUF4180 domain-containing protein n=1 Tax=Candidatus Binatus sp. TaxID=2811406 RepID=UPI002B499DD3|nr:DUF4180 domain-containing protein [Candidatus Binatus sp.]HKN12394.1 DUF4180 domain-containing protein [Candidatus Binatus sp.]
MPSTKLYELRGVRVLECAADGTKLQTYSDAVELIGKAFENRATLIVVPVECLDDDFFRLKTRIAGELIQKFVQYRRRLAIVGDISRHLAGSSALRAFVNESNRGNEVWFLASLAELDQRLEQAV